MDKQLMSKWLKQYWWLFVAQFVAGSLVTLLRHAEVYGQQAYVLALTGVTVVGIVMSAITVVWTINGED